MMEQAKQIRARFEQAGQGQVFAFFDRLDDTARQRLLEQAAEIDLTEIALLTRELLHGSGPAPLDWTKLTPAPYIAHPRNGGDATRWARARELGAAALHAGRVAAFTVAGGQGTRLGYDGPKGTFPVTPVRGASLFQVFAEKIRAAARRYRTPIPWLVMTSHANHDDTVAAFAAADYFGLAHADVLFFRQGRMPAVDFNGRILLEAPDRIAMSPDGHGGSLRALVRSGALAQVRGRGIDTISYFQVDNPLVRAIDPAFIGFHIEAGSELSSKMVPKSFPGERVGHFCRYDGRALVIEYSDLPQELQETRTADGALRFTAGSIAIHIFDAAFIERAGGGDPRYALPFHRADKKIACIDAAGRPLNPSSPNGVKFEMFVFDALPFARNPVIIETLRAEDFSPVKNAEGVDSPATCRADQLRQFARWARAAGADVAVDASGLPAVTFEISPLYADSAEALAERWRTLPAPPCIADGMVMGG